MQFNKEQVHLYFFWHKMNPWWKGHIRPPVRLTTKPCSEFRYNLVFGIFIREGRISSAPLQDPRYMKLEWMSLVNETYL